MSTASPESHVEGYRPDVDGLRAIAILVVVVFHAFPKLLPGGFVGVDIFFVISGFLISGIILKALANGRFRFADFYARRTRRIFPSLVVVLLFASAVGWVALLPLEYALLGKHVGGGALFAQNVLLWGEAGYFDTASELKPLMHLWSLAVEEQFYLLYPLLLWAAHRLRLGALTIITAVATASFFIGVARLEEHPVEVFFLSHTRFWELMIGGALAELHLSHGERMKRWLPAGGLRTQVAAVTGLVLALGSAWALSAEQPFPGVRALAPTVGAALMIAAGPSAWVNRRVLASRPMVFLGLISYPLYLWHWPLLSFAAMVTHGVSGWVRGGLVAAAVVLAWATRQFVERPFRFSPTASRGRVPVLLGAMAATAALGIAVLVKEGVPSRFPEEIRQLATFKPDYTTDARAPACWLDDSREPDDFAPECAGNPAGGAGSVWLWGDSYAARLYPGLADALGSGRVAQYTRDACGPLLNWGYPRCRLSNEYVLRLMSEQHPETVVMFANWRELAWRWPRGTAHGTSVVETLRRVKALGVKHVIVLGTPPVWRQFLPRIVHDAWKNDFPLHRIPERISGELVDGLPELDADLRGIVESEGLTFVNVRDLLCDATGCLTRTSDDATGLITWDTGHLTTPGAKYVARKLVPLLAGTPREGSTAGGAR